MAEITYNDLLGQLSGMEKDQFEGIGFGSKGFLENYQNDPNALAVTGHDNFSKFEPIAKAYQESKTIPKGNFLSNMLNFSSADASMPDQTYGLQTNTMGGVTINPDGTLNYNNTQTPKNLGFRSMVDMAADTENFDNQFNNNFADYNMSGPLRGTNTMRGSVIGPDMSIRDYQQAANRYSGMAAPQSSFFDANPRSIAAQKEKAAFQELMSRMPGSELEQDDFYENPKGLAALFQNFNIDPSSWGKALKTKAKTGWNFAQQLPGMAMGAMTGIPGIGMLMNAIGNQFEDRTLGTSNVVDEYGNVHSSADLNKMNALGGGYTDAARSSRRALARMNNMLERQALGKTYSKKNLAKMKEIQRKQRELDNLGYAGTPKGNTGSGAFAKFDNTSKNYGPHTKGGGNQGGNYGNAPGTKGGWGPGAKKDGGRVRFSDGGLATLFTRRG